MPKDEPYQSQHPNGGNNIPDHYSRKIHNQYRRMKGLAPLGKDGEPIDNSAPASEDLARFLRDEL